MKVGVPILLAFVVGVFGILAVNKHCEHNRYSLHPIEKGAAYRLDSNTGRVWLIMGNEEMPVRGAPEITDPRTPEEIAIKLVKESTVVRLHTETGIVKTLEEMKGPLRVIGWKSGRVEDQIFLVAYLYERSGKVDGWIFEVNLAARIVRSMFQDEELAKKYPPDIVAKTLMLRENTLAR
jgi:hypothetical protein